MLPTRRDFIVRSLGIAAAAAVPGSASAAAIHSEPSPADRWNTVETIPVDLDNAPRVDSSWEATGYFFVHDKHTDRATQRRIDLKGYVDGSMRIAIGAVGAFDQLRVGRGFTAVHLAPDVSAELWRGLFAQSEADTMPVEPFERQPWDHDSYIRGQSRIHRMNAIAGIEKSVEAPDDGVYRWIKLESDAA